MTRLIDADALLETLARKYPEWYTGKPKDNLKHYAWLVYYWAVKEAPTIDAVPSTIEGALGYLHKVGWMQEHDRIMTEDAVPVVRCKDCVYYQDNNNGYPHNECRWRSDETPDATDFCSFGERKDDE